MLWSPVIVRGLVVTVIGLAALVAAVGPTKPSLERRWIRWPVIALSGLSLVAGLGLAGWGVALASGDRSDRSLTIAPGVRYQRLAIDEPRRQVAHVAIVDLDEPCIAIETTRPADDGEVMAETGTEFVDRTGAALAVNVAFFFPIDEYPHWDSYPTSGDPVTAIGPVVIDGRALGRADGGWGFGVGTIDGRGFAGVLPPTANGAGDGAADVDFAVPGRRSLVADGEVVAPESAAYPRTVAGIDRDENDLVLVVADGKQPGYADGMTYREVAALLVDLGVDEAVEFDGGGSATMVATVDGRVELLSRPSHQRIPGRQRPVATHLGITLAPGCDG